jgi:hypothetical protein
VGKYTGLASLLPEPQCDIRIDSLNINVEMIHKGSAFCITWDLFKPTGGLHQWQ